MKEPLYTTVTLLEPDLWYHSKLRPANELDAAIKHLTELTASVDEATMMSALSDVSHSDVMWRNIIQYVSYIHVSCQ